MNKIKYFSLFSITLLVIGCSGSDGENFPLSRLQLLLLMIRLYMMKHTQLAGNQMLASAMQLSQQDHGLVS